MAGSTRQSRDLKKWATARRAQFRLEQALDYIDWVEDILGPEQEALLSGKVRVEFESGNNEIAQSVVKLSYVGEAPKELEDAPDSNG